MTAIVKAVLTWKTSGGSHFLGNGCARKQAYATSPHRTMPAIANSSSVFATYNPWALLKAAAPPRPHRQTAPSGLAELESHRAVQLSSPSVAPATCGRNPIPYGAYELASVET